jgi:hypothetical protein
MLFGKLVKFSGVPAGSVNTHYLLETPKGRFFLKIDEVKKLQDAQCELDLLLFLRTQRFACPQPCLTRRELLYPSTKESGLCLSLSRRKSLSEKTLSLSS